MHLTNIEVATDEQDQKECTDYVARVTEGTVAVRVRRPDCEYRDWTIRSWRASGAKTELSKLKEGFASKYLYCWTNSTDIIKEYVLIDLDVVRKKKLLEQKWPFIKNKDKVTGFISIPLNVLKKTGTIVAFWGKKIKRKMKQ